MRRPADHQTVYTQSDGEIILNVIHFSGYHRNSVLFLRHAQFRVSAARR